MPSQEVVLVTGCSGFLGSAIVRKLADKYRIVGFDRPGGEAPPECAGQIGLDLGSGALLRTTCIDRVGP